MGDYFQGWRRKIGCVTLLMGCFMMFAWVRSLDRNECIVRGYPDEIRIISANGCFRVQREKWEIGIHRGRWWEHLNDGRHRPQGIDNDEEPMEGQQVLWRVTSAGFHFGSGLTWGGRGSTAQVYSCVIPYFAVATPLTALSAYLLLSKPRRAKIPVTQPDRPPALR